MHSSYYGGNKDVAL